MEDAEETVLEPELEIPAPQNKKDAVDDSDDTFRFDKSLQELRGLRSQLHYAADYCEQTFLKAQDKKIMVDNTKEYISKAVVTFVDHLGNVSANLDHCISLSRAFSEAELRINCLKQRLDLCDQYAQKVALTRLRWNPVLPRHHRRYLSTSITTVEKRGNEEPDRNSKQFIDKHVLELDDLPLFLYTSATKSRTPPSKPCSAVEENQSASPLVPVRDVLSVSSKATNPTFHFQQFGPPRNRRRASTGDGFRVLITSLLSSEGPKEHHNRPGTFRFVRKNKKKPVSW